MIVKIKQHSKIISYIFIVLLIFFQFAIAYEGDLAPDFKLQDLDKGFVSLGSYKDKQPVLLFFWTTWCPFCRREIKLLNEKYSELAREGLKILTINIGERPERLERFVKNYSLNVPVALDIDTSVAYDYGILGVPTYVLINDKGYIVFEDNYFPKNYKDLITKGIAQ